MSQNRELVVFYLNYKLSQMNYPLYHMGLVESSNSTDGREAGLAEAQRETLHGNGSSSGTNTGTPPESSQQRLPSPRGMDAVKEALKDTANKFESLYARALRNLHTQLHITPAITYRSFETVMDEMFREEVNWGRIIMFFVIGGALCVQCVEGTRSLLVDRIIEWMTVYLDNNIQPWIQTQGGWERFAELYGRDPTAEVKKPLNTFKKWLLSLMTLVAGIAVGFLITRAARKLM